MSASRTACGLDFLRTPKVALLPLDSADAKEWVTDLAERARGNDCPRLAAELGQGGSLAAMVGAVLDLSPFLRGELLKQPSILERLFDAPVEACIDALIAEIAGLDTCLEVATAAPSFRRWRFRCLPRCEQPVEQALGE